MAIRAALGAGQGRLVRQYLTESLLLALLGGGAGLVLASWASGFLSSLSLGTDLPLRFDFRPDARVYVFALAAVLFTGLFVGMMPALRAARTNVSAVLHEGGRGSSSGPRRQFVRNALVVAQVAGSLVLLIVAGLFMRSLEKAEKMNLGFILSTILQQGLRLALSGAGVGGVGALIVSRLMAGVLYGVSPADPLTFAGVAVLLILVALFACYIPALRVDPRIALRHE
jgi:putative ABC transport system permease protein